MELNEKTYETYLLLYIDNELSAEERNAFEAHIQANPNLQSSLDALKNTVQKAPHIVFEDKALLYRFDALEASLDYDYKKTLYKKEPGTIVTIGFKQNLFQYASIAALLLIVIGMGYQYFNTKLEQPIGIASNAINNIRSKELSTFSTEPHDNTIASVNSNIITIKNNNGIKKDQNTSTLTHDTSFIIAAPMVEKEAIVSENSTNTILPEQITQAAIVAENKTSIVPPIETTAPIEEINTENNDHIIYISNFEIDGDKIRGFTRRVNALFKRNKTDKN